MFGHWKVANEDTPKGKQPQIIDATNVCATRAWSLYPLRVFERSMANDLNKHEQQAGEVTCNNRSLTRACNELGYHHSPGNN